MTVSPLTPALALAYLHELSLDVRAAVVLGVAGEMLAGDASFADRARSSLAAGGDAPGARIERSDGEALVCARAASGFAIAVLAGDLALLPLLAHDVEAVLGDLDGVS
jgi:hypothetical protein